MNTPHETAWIGWYRPGKRHRWAKLSEADNYGDALSHLLNAVAKLPGGAELLVSQTDPNQRKRHGARPS